MSFVKVTIDDPSTLSSIHVAGTGLQYRCPSEEAVTIPGVQDEKAEFIDDAVKLIFERVPQLPQGGR
jgi:hypothetical protein